jgi:hypothetical protein
MFLLYTWEGILVSYGLFILWGAGFFMCITQVFDLQPIPRYNSITNKCIKLQKNVIEVRLWNFHAACI